MTLRVPFLDLKRGLRPLRNELNAAIASVLDAGAFILDGKVDAFEKEFARYCGVSSAVGVASGTDALHLALRACGVGQGDEVITVANTCVPTIAGILQAGATPVFADIDASTLTLDPGRIEKNITPRTKAILPVHLYGRCAPMEAILKIARAHKLRVVEDCAQAHGTHWNGRKAGVWGDAGCYSFYPTKNLGALGDGGMVVTGDAAVAARVRELRNYGQTTRYHHATQGFNSRLDELQASVLLVKLKFLDAMNAKRRRIALRYAQELKGSAVVCPPDDTGHAYHLFVVRVKERERFRVALEAQGVETLVHYATPVPLQPAYIAYRASMAELPETSKACAEVVSLPLYPELSDEEAAVVVRACRGFA